MTAAVRAKELGAKSLSQVADVYGCTTENLRSKYKKHPRKFDIIVLGVVAIQDSKRGLPFITFEVNNERD